MRGDGSQRGRTVVAGVIHRRLPPFEAFLDSNRATVYRYLVAAVGPIDADDVFQETFLAALRAYPRCTDPTRLDRWVLRIASRKAIDHHRGVARRPIPVAAPPDLPVADGDPAADGLGPAVAAVSDLPSRQRDAVAYRHVLGLSVAETATLMGTSEDAVRANAYQGIKRLKERATWTKD
jgi:DNA-directed RNA polymerase specialized sigma24 family protein